MDYEAICVWATAFDRPLDEEHLARDLKRVARHWKGENRVWLLPDATGVVRWERFPGWWECVVPTETFNYFDTFFVDRDRRLFPPLLEKGPWSKRLPSCLYSLWLNKLPAQYATPRTVRLEVPRIQNGSFAGYEEQEFPTQPGPLFPIEVIDPDRRIIGVRWPGKDDLSLETVSPETESRARHGVPEFEHGDPSVPPVVVSSNGDRRSLATFYGWREEPFRTLFPCGGGMDLIFHHAYMRRVIAQLRTDASAALQDARFHMSRFTWDAESTMELAYFFPKFLTADAKGSYANLRCEMAERFGIEANSIKELMSSDRFRTLMSKRVPIRIVYSWLGYMWWELCRDITEYRFAGICQSCGRVITGGRRDRKFCRPEENRACSRKRGVERQRKYRWSTQGGKS